ncbi:MAG: deoxynucleoside kinase [Candidatus Nomurabacteria bacterium]|nr:deoxynucleoside kinase [Candidatus Nomurabacteria bacterium]
MKKGKLIVIDGTDGSGKATQVELLRLRLVKEGYKVKTVDFPEYYKNFFGNFIGHCLSEQYFNFVKVHPKIASVLYAADRWESSDQIDGWLKSGCIVIANRYVSANQIHQGGKITNAKKRKDFLRWLDDMEYRVFGIPRPDVVIYLEVPIKVTQKLMIERDAKNARQYLKKKGDVHENDPVFLENSRKSALKLIKELNNFIKISCVKGFNMRAREDIHEDVYLEIKKVLK